MAQYGLTKDHIMENMSSLRFKSQVRSRRVYVALLSGQFIRTCQQYAGIDYAFKCLYRNVPFRSPAVFSEGCGSTCGGRRWRGRYGSYQRSRGRRGKRNASSRRRRFSRPAYQCQKEKAERFSRIWCDICSSRHQTRRCEGEENPCLEACCKNGRREQEVKIIGSGTRINFTSTCTRTGSIVNCIEALNNTACSIPPAPEDMIVSRNKFPNSTEDPNDMASANQALDQRPTEIAMQTSDFAEAANMFNAEDEDVGDLAASRRNGEQIS
eukprot:284815887_6